MSVMDWRREVPQTVYEGTERPEEPHGPRPVGVTGMVTFLRS